MAHCIYTNAYQIQRATEPRVAHCIYTNAYHIHRAIEPSLAFTSLTHKFFTLTFNLVLFIYLNIFRMSSKDSMGYTVYPWEKFLSNNESRQFSDEKDLEACVLLQITDFAKKIEIIVCKVRIPRSQ
jgi:hypothetical protein